MSGITYNYLIYSVIFLGFGGYLIYSIVTREKGDFSYEFIIKILFCVLAVSFSCKMVVDTTLDVVNEDVVEKSIVCERVERSNRINWRVKYLEDDSNIHKFIDYPLFSSFRFEEGKRYIIKVTRRTDILLEVEEVGTSE